MGERGLSVIPGRKRRREGVSVGERRYTCLGARGVPKWSGSGLAYLCVVAFASVGCGWAEVLVVLTARSSVVSWCADALLVERERRCVKAPSVFRQRMRLV